MPPASQTRVIKIKIDSGGNQELKALANGLADVNKNTKNISSSFNLLNSAFGGFLGLEGIVKVTHMSDEMQNLGNRLKIVSVAGEDTSQTMQKIFDLAQETKLSISDVGQTYTRLGATLKSAGATSDELIALTRVLTNSFKVSGSTASEAASGVIELTQSFSRGTLEGRQLRSITLENNVLAEALREKFGNDLVGAGEQGLITVSGVLEVLSKHLKDINDRAALLTPTFEQSMTRAFNTTTKAVGDLNEKFHIAEGFADVLQKLTDKFTLIIAVVSPLALYWLPTLAAAIYGVAGSLVVFTLSNPWTAAFYGLGIAIIFIFKNLGSLEDFLRKIGSWFVWIAAKALELTDVFFNKLAPTLKRLGLIAKDSSDHLAGVSTEVKSLLDVYTGLNVKKFSVVPDKKETDQGADAIANLNKRYKKLHTDIEEGTVKDELAKINIEWLKGAESIQQYNAKIDKFELFKLNTELKEGKINVFQFHEQMDKFKEADFNRQLEQGTITLSEYNAGINNLKISELNDKFASGKISVTKYHEELTKLTTSLDLNGGLIAGTSEFIESIGTVASNIADGIKNTFSSLETSLEDFIKTGKFNFTKFTQGILDDLTKIIIRATIIRPLANGILGAFTPSTPTQSSITGPYGEVTNGIGDVQAANGFAFDRGIQKFASGGIVDNPTGFSYGAGRKGLMGEAGPEAIIPLQRGSGGKLGIGASVTPVIVNVINQTGNQVEQKESTGPNGEKTLDIIITGKVREGLASGKYDKAMQASYGLNRKGS